MPARRRDSARETPDVVVVDDDTELVAMIRFGLEASHYSVATYDNGPEALAAIMALPTRGPPRLLLLDIDLPGMDGHTLHEQLRVTAPGRFTVVFLSTRHSDADQMRASAGGAVDFLVKPVSIPVLLAKVDVWLQPCADGS